MRLPLEQLSPPFLFIFFFFPFFSFLFFFFFSISILPFFFYSSFSWNKTKNFSKHKRLPIARRNSFVQYCFFFLDFLIFLFFCAPSVLYFLTFCPVTHTHTLFCTSLFLTIFICCRLKICLYFS